MIGGGVRKLTTCCKADRNTLRHKFFLTATRVLFLVITSTITERPVTRLRYTRLEQRAV